MNARMQQIEKNIDLWFEIESDVNNILDRFHHFIKQGFNYPDAVEQVTKEIYSKTQPE